MRTWGWVASWIAIVGSSYLRQWRKTAEAKALGLGMATSVALQTLEDKHRWLNAPQHSQIPIITPSVEHARARVASSL